MGYGILHFVNENVELYVIQRNLNKIYNGRYSEKCVTSTLVLLLLGMLCDVNFLGLLMQYDVYGDLLGLLGAHPVSPLVSLHHLDVVQPIFPRMTRVRALRHLMESVNQDSGSIMQQSICYDKQNFWSISVSWGSEKD